MLRRLLPVLLALLAIGVLAAGCGGDDDDGGETTAVETTTAETTTDTAAEETTTEETTTDETTEDDGDVDPEVSQAQQQCKQAVSAAGSALSADTKADIEELCDDLDSADPEALEETAREICVRVVEETLPEGPARDEAVTRCESAAIAP